MLERLYLDSCVLSRPTDDQMQERINLESVAIAHILDLAADGSIEWISSSVLHLELSRNPDRNRRDRALELLALATIYVPLSLESASIARNFARTGYGAFDALHLAIAKHAGATSLITVDDRFRRRAELRKPGELPLVENPVDWLRRRQPWLIKR